MAKLLSARHIDFSFSDGQVLKDISFDLNRGEVLGILGPNGGGKSTLLNLIAGLLKPNKGSFTWSFKKDAHISTKIGILTQAHHEDTLFPFRVKDVLLMGQKLRTGLPLVEALGWVKLGPDFLDKKFATLSGGQKQKVLLIKSFISLPEIVIWDEPTNALDSEGRDQLLFMARELKKRDISIIMVDHSIDEVLKISDQVLCLNKVHHSHTAREGLTKEILENIYHCEFEHLILHQKSGPNLEHHLCGHHGEGPVKNVRETKKEGGPDE